MSGQRPIGAIATSEGPTSFTVWAPVAERVELVLRPDDGERRVELPDLGDGERSVAIDDAPAGTRYGYSLDGGPVRPDPASRFQPEGVHGPSEVVDFDVLVQKSAFANPSLDRHVFYELHVGTFTAAGTFEGVIERLDDLRALGVTALQLMPVAQFPGGRNWGYDGVLPFAAQSTYGGPTGLRRLIDAAHERGLAVYLDVVYNHLGPEGNYLREFGPYFTGHYTTPWGEALNFDDADSDRVRRYFVDSALWWTRDMGFDGLRLDAVHAIVDNSPLPFVEQLAAEVRAACERRGRAVHVIAESAANDARLIRPAEVGGIGCDAQWNDDFHHALRAALTGETGGYYQDYGPLRCVAKAMDEGYVYTGERSRFRRRSHGRPAKDRPASCFVVFCQNHDQVGNRLAGDRLDASVDFESRKLAACATLLSPFVPMLFMGEEHGEPAPFQYFVSHGDPGLVEAVRKGRKAEFRSFGWREDPPDPQDEATFERSKPDWGLVRRGDHARLRRMYEDLLALRRTLGLGSREPGDRRRVDCREDEGVLVLHRLDTSPPTLAVFNFDAGERAVSAPRVDGAWSLAFDSSSEAYGGPGGLAPAVVEGAIGSVGLRARSAALYRQEGA